MRYVCKNEADAPGGSINVTSTSRNTADVTPFLLRDETDTHRFSFEPVLVNNENHPDNSVSGKIVYEVKGKGDSIFPSQDDQKTISKKDIRKGDSLELTLRTGEARNLYEGLRKLYQLHETIGGISYGRTTYVELDNASRSLLQLLRKDPSAARMISTDETFALIKELLRLLTTGTTHTELQAILGEMEDGNLQQLASGLNLEQMKRAAKEIEANLQNGDEEFWQNKVFIKYQWLISQIFSTPYTLYDSKSYVGGKAISNAGGNIADFIFQNKITSNISIVEIKTPRTKLLGNRYRNSSFSVSGDLSGAIAQVLSYRQSILNEFANIRISTGESFEAFNPQCVIIIGNTSELEGSNGSFDRDKLSSFENFRNCLTGIVVITYDELLQRVKDTVALLDSELPENVSNPGYAVSNTRLQNAYDDDTPF